MVKKKPDKLSQEVAMALAAGMSYGKWKAMQQPVKPVVDVEIPEGWRKCEYCGKLFKKKCGKRFCEEYCREQAYAQRATELRTEYMRKYREKVGFKE